MDQINEMLTQLSELDESQLTQLESSIVSEFETVEKQELSAQQVEQLDALANAAEAVRNEQTRRAQEQEILSTKAAEAAARVRGDDASTTAIATPDPEEIPAPEEAPQIPVAEEDPDAETEPDAPSPADESDEEDEEKKFKGLAHASTDAVEESTLSADTQTTTDAEQPAGSEASVMDEAPAVQNQEPSEAPVTAAVPGSEELVIEPPADRRPQIKSATVAITAGADIPGVSAGTPLRDMNEVAEAFVKRLHTLRRVNGGDGEQHIVASIQVDYPDDLHLRSDDAEKNLNKIRARSGSEALVAAGGWVAPLESRYDVYSVGGSTARPVRDALVRFGADRGGIRYLTPPSLPSVGANIATSGISTWTAANDASPSSPTVKPTYIVPGGSEVTATVDALTLSLQFGNFQTRAYPERVARFNELALIQHARYAEDVLLADLKAGSTNVTSGTVLGAVRDFLVTLGRAVAAYRHRHRLEAVQPLRAIAPLWLKDMLRADIAMQMPGDGLDETLNLADAKIEAWLRARNVNITWHLDGTGFGTQTASALLDFPATVEWALFAEGTWLFLDGGTLDLGIIRDSTLVGTNDYKMFVETFEATAKVGVESLWVTSTIDNNGAAAALQDTIA